MILVALAVTVGMWFERFVIIVVSLHQDYLPSAWHVYKPTLVDFGSCLVPLPLFTLVLLFARVLPVIATTEVKAILPGAHRSTEASMSERAFAVLGLFDTADALMEAIPRVRGKVSGRLEAYTPYPSTDWTKHWPSPFAHRGMVMIMGAVGAATALVSNGG